MALRVLLLQSSVVSQPARVPAVAYGTCCSSQWLLIVILHLAIRGLNHLLWVFT